MFMIHRTKRKAMARVSRQHGMSLIESLVALLVLALGIMGLAGVQARMLAENRTTNSRAIAVSLIEDLANRMQLNRDAALSGACLLYTSPSPRDRTRSRMPSSA